MDARAAEEKPKYFFWGMMENTVPGCAVLVPPPERFLMLYIRSGSGKITQGENSRHLGFGSILFLRFGLTFRIDAAEGPLVFTSFLGSGPSEAFPFLCRIPAGSLTERRLGELAQIGARSPSGNAVPEFEALLESIKSIEGIQAFSKHAGSIQIEALKRILDSRFTEPLHLEQLAEELNLNKYRLIRDFKSRYGVPPIEYLVRCRIREACRLLQETTESVTEIGSQVGMENTPYFIRIFREKVGCTPYAYRQSLQAISEDKK